jgi:hypothetical protein
VTNANLQASPHGAAAVLLAMSLFLMVMLFDEFGSAATVAIHPSSASSASETPSQKQCLIPAEFVYR